MAAVSSRLQRGLGLDIALGAAHGVLVDRLDGGLGRVILLVVTYMKEAMSILATVLLKHRSSMDLLSFGFQFHWTPNFEVAVKRIHRNDNALRWGWG